MKVAVRTVEWAAMAGVLLSLGCASRTMVQVPNQTLCPEGATTAEVVEAAYKVLAGMHFAIEKLDAEQGIVKTRPLRGAQFFEFWRGDNAGVFNTAEANLHSIRRIVEIRVKPPECRNAEISTHLPTHSIECSVQVQRLALPANEVAGSSRAYQMHTRSTASLLRFEVTPQQQAGMAWIDLGQDSELAVEILRRIERRLIKN